MSDAGQVREAAAKLVAAFSRHDVHSYFDSFAPSATFIFHNVDRVLQCRAEYEGLWGQWEADGFRVLGCTSLNGSVQMVGDDAAVFHHSVRTTLADRDGTVETGERETIVFRKIDGIWLGVHEHLSVDPTF